MEPTTRRTPSRPGTGSPPERTLLLSSAFPAAEATGQMGREAYSYHFVQQAFMPLLARWGETCDVTPAESRLDFAIRRATAAGRAPVHLSFLPLQQVYLSRQAPNVAFPFWEFPDIPNEDLRHNRRSNWAWMADQLDLVLVASTATREAFLRAGVETPVHVVPVPLEDAYLAVEPWRADQAVVLQGPCYEFPHTAKAPAAAPDPWSRAVMRPPNPRAWLKHVYQTGVKPRLPEHWQTGLNLARRALQTILRVPSKLEHTVPHPLSPALELSGVVYTTLVNPFDPRKNWHDLMSAYLLALRDCADATLVIKIVAAPENACLAVNGLRIFYEQLGLQHRCRLVLLPGYLDDRQMVELARGSTYYVNASRAEGACLPLQSFLAAGRPGLAPVHSALGDYFHDGVGHVIDSHPEPASWPHDPSKRCTTTWHRLVWQSLHDAFRASYAEARGSAERYRSRARRARGELAAFAGADEVWPRLAAALDSVVPTSGRRPAAVTLPAQVAS